MQPADAGWLAGRLGRRPWWVGVRRDLFCRGVLTAMREVVRQRYLMSDADLAICHRSQYPIDLAARFRKRQQDGAVENIAVLVTGRATEAHGLLFLGDAPDMPGDELEERALQTFGNTLPVEGRPCRIAQGISHMREAGVCGDLVDVDHHAMGPIGAEVPWIDLRALGETIPGELLPDGEHAGGQATLLLQCGHGEI